MVKKVVVGISGGVDSAVSALLLKEQGYQVIGLFMRNWDSQINNDILGNKAILENDICPQEQDYLDALAICKTLNIKLHRVDFVKEYWDYVFSYFLKEYQLGRTPNPDILCNKFIKFDAFAKYAFEELNADAIAMGHYAKTEKDPQSEIVYLKRAADENKDQTYFLSHLSQAQIQKVLFPLGDLTKPAVRQLATDFHLVVANKKDSTGICFIGERDFKGFLQNYIPNQPGNIIDIDTKKKLGTHIGTMYYTIGQSKGLFLGGQSERYFVCQKDLAQKIIYVCSETNIQHLFTKSFRANDIHWTLPIKNIKKLLASALDNDQLKIRYRHRQKLQTVALEFSADFKEVIIKSTIGLRAVTPGQAVVFYYQDICLGGATII